ncbi:MAG: hypothetical protein ACQESC_02650 [Nanobdellota archaeon]
MKTTVIAYGGSIIIPGSEYDLVAIQRLANIIKEHPQRQFIFIIGGGKLCRYIQQDVKEPLTRAKLDEKELSLALDEIGIAVTKINAKKVINELTRILGEDMIYQHYIDDPKTLPPTDKQVIIASGYKPGVTTDYCMMKLAELSHADSAIKVSNFPFVLNVKPTEFNKENISEYEQLFMMNWDEITALVGTESVPGGNYPLDPPSAHLGKELADKQQFTLYIAMNTELEAILKQQSFTGTTIKK